MLHRYRLLSLGLLLGGCAHPAPGSILPPPDAALQTTEAVAGTDSAFTLGQMGEFIRHFNRLDSTAQRAEVRRLQSIEKRGAGDRLMLAWLLSLNNAPAADLVRADEQLDGLERQFEDPATREFVRMLQRNLALELAFRKEKKRAAELQEKLQQIKNLELELQERSQAGQSQGK